MRPVGRVWAGVLAFLWLAAIVTLYYASHKPFSPALALGLVTAAWPALVAAALLSLAGGLGARLLADLPLRPLARLAVQAGLGLGLFSLAALLVGALGGFRPWVIGVSLLLAGLALRRSIVSWWLDWRDLLAAWQGGGRLGRLVGLVAGLILLATLFTALAPPLKFDALVYHLALPHAYLAAGRLAYVPEIMFWGMPQAGEMLYTLAIALGGDPAAGVLGWLVGLTALAGLLGYSGQRLGLRAGWVSVASLLAGFSLATALAWAYVDWLAILMGLGCLVALDLWQREVYRPAILLAGVFAGLAIGTKYSAGVLLVSGLVSITWHLLRQGAWRAVLRPAGRFGLAAVFFALPWGLKNLLATGNPLYPGLFPSGAMDRLRLDLYQGGPAWGNWQDVLLLPLRATYLGIEGAPGYSAAVGPLLLGLAVAAFVAWPGPPPRYRRTVRNAALVALPGLLVWMLAGRITGYLLQARLYFVLFPALAVLAGAGWAGLSRLVIASTRFNRLAGALIALVMLLAGFEVGMYTLRQGAPQVVLGLQTRQEYLANNLGWYAPAMQAVGELPPGARVLMLWEARSLYCASVCIPDEVLDRWAHDRQLLGGDGAEAGEQVLQAWRQAGYTHLLLHRAGMEFMRSEGGPQRPEDWPLLDALLTSLPVVQDFGGAYQLYGLAP